MIWCHVNLWKSHVISCHRMQWIHCHCHCHNGVWYDIIWHDDVMWYDIWCDVMWRDVTRHGVKWRDVTWHGNDNTWSSVGPGMKNYSAIWFKLHTKAHTLKKRFWKKISPGLQWPSFLAVDVLRWLWRMFWFDAIYHTTFRQNWSQKIVDCSLSTTYNTV